MKAYTLPNPVVPEPDESLAGLLMRNAERYRFRNPVRLLHRLNLNVQFVPVVCQADPAGELGLRLRALLGLDNATYLRHTAWSADEDREGVLGHGVWKELIRADRRAVCPDCLRELPHHRAVWNVAALPICAVHGKRLVDRCPACRRPLVWNGRSLCLCQNWGCSHDLRKATAEEVDIDALPSVKALPHLLLSCDALAGTPPGIPAGELVTIAYLLGRVAVLPAKGRGARPMPFIERHPDRVPGLMDAGWRALDDWPNGFNALLDTLKARARGKRGVAQAFGNLSKMVFDWSRQPWGLPIGKAFAEYAASQPDLAVSAETLRRYAPGAELRQSYMSVLQAAALFGFSAGAMMRLAERRGLFVLAPQGMGVPSLLPADEVKALRDEFEDSVGVEEARKFLGVTFPTMQKLEAAGMVRRQSEATRIMEVKPFLRSELTALIAACGGAGPTVTSARAAEMGLTAVVRGQAPEHGTVQICQALMDGRLKARACVGSARGLLRPRVDMEEVNRALPVGRATMSIVEAAATIRTKYWNLHTWAKHGFLVAAKTDDPRERGLRIEPADWARFRSEFVVGTDMRVLLGKAGYQWLSRHLLHQGVRPVSGPGVDEGEQMLFRRSDCTPEVVAAIRGLRKTPRGTPRQKADRAVAKSTLGAEAVARAWGCKFERKGNRFTEIGGNRVLQAVAGRRADLTGVFRFMLRPSSIAAMAAEPHGWAALVPSKGDTFLVVPFGMLEWRGKPTDAQYVSVPFDARDRPGDFQGFAMTLPGAGA